MFLSGVSMVIVGVWLVAQALGGNLAGRLRSFAASGVSAGPRAPATSTAPAAPGSGGPLVGSGGRGGGGGGGGAW